jgi:hypothetical protein
VQTSISDEPSHAQDGQADSATTFDIREEIAPESLASGYPDQSFFDLDSFQTPGLDPNCDEGETTPPKSTSDIPSLLEGPVVSHTGAHQIHIPTELSPLILAVAPNQPDLEPGTPPSLPQVAEDRPTVRLQFTQLLILRISEEKLEAITNFLNNTGATCSTRLDMKYFKQHRLRNVYHPFAQAGDTKLFRIDFPTFYLCSVCFTPISRGTNTKGLENFRRHVIQKRVQCAVCEIAWMRSDNLGKHQQTIAGFRYCANRKPPG